MTAPTGNPEVDSIIWGGVTLPSNTVTYFFSNDYQSWNATEKESYRAALDAWAAVASLTFTEVTLSGGADLVEHVLTNTQMNTLLNNSSGVILGYHETPDDHATYGDEYGYFNMQGFGLPEFGVSYAPSGLVVGGYGYVTFLHELGHALGLAHPHDTGGGSPIMPGVSADIGDYGDNDLNQAIFTVMSYNDGWTIVQDPYGNGVSTYGYNSGPAAFDIAAIQYLYGANMATGSGNDVYVIPETGGWSAIWDTGGTDLIKYAGTGNVVIDLNSATLDNSPTGGGSPSYVVNGGQTYYGGYTIAGDFTNVLANVNGETGVIIENASGGLGDDIIIGNDVANVLKGRRGDDLVSGHDGNDTLYGHFGRDKLLGGPGDDILYGGHGKDTLKGGDGDDLLDGGNGPDALWSGNGTDTLVGGDGADTFYFKDGFDSDVIWDFTDDIDVLKINDDLWGGGAMTVAQLLATYADDSGADIVFDFGNGDMLTLTGIDDKSVLSDDLIIV